MVADLKRGGLTVFYLEAELRTDLRQAIKLAIWLIYRLTPLVSTLRTWARYQGILKTGDGRRGTGVIAK